MNLEDTIGYSFKEKNLLALALTHPSLSKSPSNQRLEFLGDAILSAVIAHILYSTFPDEAEGDLAKRHTGLVRAEALTKIARNINLGKALRVASGEAQAGGRDNASNLEDAMEALIGALYLDGGLSAAEKFIKSHWLKLLDDMALPPKDAKTSLQEWAQAKGLPVPAYTLVETSGPAHAPQFIVEVSVEGEKPERAQAASKRAAEQLAANALLQNLSV